MCGNHLGQRGLPKPMDLLAITGMKTEVANHKRELCGCILNFGNGGDDVFTRDSLLFRVS
jgi:hypothetical protein